MLLHFDEITDLTLLLLLLLLAVETVLSLYYRYWQ